MKVKLDSHFINDTKFTKKEIGGTTIYEPDVYKNGCLLMDIYQEDDVPHRKLDGESDIDTVDLSEDFGIKFEGVDGMIIQGLEIEKE